MSKNNAIRTKKRILISLFLVVASTIAVFHSFEGKHQQRVLGLFSRNQEDPKTVQTKDASLLFVTLSYDAIPGDEHAQKKRAKFQPVILNNCLLVKNAGHTMRIYTDDLKQEHCNHCDCRRFESYNCRCPMENCTGHRNICEKNHLYSDLLTTEREFVFLDHDLTIVKPEPFFRELYARSRTVDFLATRAHGSYKLNVPSRYREDFNSGLVFIRAIPGVDPMILRDILYEKERTLYDQHVLSQYIHRHYGNRWDELSIKWHCRLLNEIFTDMPLEDCYTIHDFKLVRALNYTLVTASA